MATDKTEFLARQKQEDQQPTPALGEKQVVPEDTKTSPLALTEPDLRSLVEQHRDFQIPKLPATARDALAEAWIGKTLGKYRIAGVLGRGGMGVVLKGHDPIIERDVALKILAEHLAADGTALRRFLAEAKAAGKLNHPNICAIYEICQQDQIYYLAMEYLPGGSWGEEIEKGRACTPQDATRALIDACEGIAAAHAVGLVHRDIKPGNFMRAADGSTKVVDFGLAKITLDKTLHLTDSGMVVGTPFFMSPEQCDAGPVGPHSDIYSLGATYYTLLTGKNPFRDSQTVPQIMYAHCFGPIPDPRAVVPGLPEACSQVVARAMAKSPADRYQSAGEMCADLQAVAAMLKGATLVALPELKGAMIAPSPRLVGATAAASSSPSGIRQSAPVVPGSARVQPRRRSLIMAAIAMIACGGLVAGGVLWSRHKQEPAAESSGPVLGGVPTGEPILVGVLHSLSGTMANSESVVVDATLFAIDEINQGGGLLGRPIKAIVVDGRSDPSTFVREAKRLITQDKVVTVFGCWTSASRKTVKAVFEEQDNLLVYPVQYEGLEASPNILYVGSAPNQQIIPAIEWAVATLKKKRFFLVGSDYVFPRTANEVIKDLLKEHGAEIVGERYLPLGGHNVQPVIDSIVQAKPDMILNTINGDSNTAFFRGLRAAGIKQGQVPTMSFSIGVQELRELDSTDTEGDYAASTYFETIVSPENMAFLAKFHEKYPQRSVTDPMESAYVGVKLWSQAVTEAQSIESKKIRRALLNQRLRAPDGEVRVDADTQHCYRTPRIGLIRADGQFEIVWTAPAPYAPEPFPGTRSAQEWKAYLHDLYAGWGNQWSAPQNKR